MSDKRPRSKMRTVIAFAVAAARKVPTAPAIRMPVGASSVKKSIRPTYAKKAYKPIRSTKPSFSLGMVASMRILPRHLNLNSSRSDFYIQNLSPFFPKRFLNGGLRVRLHQKKNTSSATRAADLRGGTARALGRGNQFVDELCCYAGGIFAPM